MHSFRQNALFFPPKSADNFLTSPQNMWVHIRSTSPSNEYPQHLFSWRKKKATLFDLITTHIPISAQSSYSVVFTSVPFCLLFKGICCKYPFVLHGHVDAIEMGTYNICFYKENRNKKKTKKETKTTQTSYRHHLLSPSQIFF